MDATELSTSELISFIGAGVDVLAGSCDAKGHPCICRAVSVELDEARYLTVVLERSVAVALIEAIRCTRQVAVDLMARCSLQSLSLSGTDACFVCGDGHRRAISDRRNTHPPRVDPPDSVCRFGCDPTWSRAGGSEQAFTAFRFRARAVRGRLSGQASASVPAMFAGVPFGTGGAMVGHRPREPLQGHVHRLLEDGVPLAVCTVSAGGTPRLARLAPVVWLDERHLAIALPNGDGTCRNLRDTGRMALYLADPRGAVDVRMYATWLHAETSGPVVDRLRVRVAALAWHAGTSDIWQFHGAEVLAVQEISALPPGEPSATAPGCRAVLPELRRLSEHMARCDRLEDLLDVSMAGLACHLGVVRSILWLLETQRQRLVLLASHGYAEPGVGAELSLGHGLVGIAAVSGLPVRIAWLPHATTRGQENDEPGGARSGTVPICPGLPAPGSQLAVPLLARGRVVGVLFVETDGHERCLDIDDEDALTVLAGQLAVSLAMLHVPAAGETADEPCHKVPMPRGAMRGRPLAVRYYEHDGSVFLDDEYLIKGVAGMVFVKLVRAHLQCGRSEFSTRELRLCAAELRLPDVRDNLYARLLLLQRRLAERAAPVRIERTGRGRFRLAVECTLRLVP